MSPSSNEETVRRYWQAHGSHDHATVSELHHPAFEAPAWRSAWVEAMEG